MDMKNVLQIKNAEEFRDWLSQNCEKESECWLSLKRGKPNSKDFCYLDAVEVALCYGWIDNCLKKIDGQSYQRFSPRRKNSPWTELNKERVRRLEKLGLMTDAGRKVLPNMNKELKLPEDVKSALIENHALENFNNFPDLYKRIRIYNLVFCKTNNQKSYNKTLDNFIKNTKVNKMYGQWNDYGRL